MKKSGVLAGKNKMSNQTASAIGAITTVVNWERKGLNLQAIIRDANKGLVGKPLTDWLVNQSWNHGKFTTRNVFKLKKDGGLFFYTGENLQAWFGDIVQEIEILSPLKSIILETSALDKDLILRLGGVQQVISGLQDIWRRIEAQPKGPKSPAGDLLTSGDANIFYIPQPVTKKGGNSFSYINLAYQEIVEEVQDPQYLFKVGGKCYVLREICVHWDDAGDGWRALARSVEHSHALRASCKVFCRNSALNSSKSDSASS